MISIVCCSIQPERARALENSIRSTIGVPFEFLKIDNTEHPRGLAEVYNAAAAGSKFPFLCFAHEDINFHSADWGPLVVDALSNPGVAVVGVCGSVFLASVPCSWTHVPNRYWRASLADRGPDGSVRHWQRPAHPGQTSEVVVLDGCFLATRKDLWSEVRFDGTNFPGFHGYDLDFTLRARSRGKCVVHHGVFIEHESPGSFSKSWIKAARKFSRLHVHELPANCANMKPRMIEFLELYALRRFIRAQRASGALGPSFLADVVRFFRRRSRFRRPATG